MAALRAQKMELFCIKVVELRCATAAYEFAYKASHMKRTTITRNAKTLMDNPKVIARIDELKAPVREKAQLTLESHLERLNYLSEKAEKAMQFNAAITAEVSRGKAAGLYVERVDHSSKDGSMSSSKVGDAVIQALINKHSK